MDNIYDLIIIGSGPAGLSAGVYAKRACLNVVLFEDMLTSGGQIINTYEVENYLGINKIDGYSLAQKFKEHALSLGLNILSEKVIQIINPNDKIKIVKTNKAEYKTKTIIVATGASPAKLSVDGEEKFTGMGVSYCATCDGAFYKDKVTAVVGGGDVALEDALFLARMCNKVYLIHRRDEFRAAKALQDEAKLKNNIEILWNTTVYSINGDETVNSISVKNAISGEMKNIDVHGVFIAVGTNPISELLNGIVEMDRNYIKAGEDCKTSVPGIFACGDVRTKVLRQVSTAVADGAVGITSVNEYLREFKD